MTLEDIYTETVEAYPRYVGKPATDEVKRFLRYVIGKQYEFWKMGADNGRAGKPRIGYEIVHRAVVECMPHHSSELHEGMARSLLEAYSDGYSSVGREEEEVIPWLS